jgi:sigma-54 dependent transcriptional regulator, flagellar regulatory protein
LKAVKRLTSQSLFIGTSDEAIKLVRLISLCADSDASILIQGETGSGKEVVCGELHRQSPRSSNNLVGINCAAIPAQLLESELFGHKKGAFSGAIADRVGRFQLADKGTLFLDEIGDMPLELQVKMLRVLEERVVTPVGSTAEVPIDVRVVSATHQDLSAMVERKEFREDLYYRLNVIPIAIPPLRERQADIGELCHHFALLHGNGRNVSFTPRTMDYLLRYAWPGNVRELSNLIKRLLVLAPQDEIELSEFPEAYLPAGLAESIKADQPSSHEDFKPEINSTLLAQFEQSNDAELGRPVSEVERIIRLSNSIERLPSEGVATKSLLSDLESNLIRAALAQSDGNVSKAAKLLQLGRTTLIQKLEKYKISASV